MGENKPFLVITGMHRSGTSFLARALNLSGVFLGNHESLTSTDLKFFKDNLRGHWENKKILELTQESLKSNNGTWHEIPYTIKISHILRKKISREIHKLMNYNSLASGFKDPRIILLFESWHKSFPKNTILIGIYRHPLEVAESLKNRDGFDYAKSLNLWKIYNEKLLQCLEKNGGFLLDFDWSKDRLISELKLIIRKLGLDENIDLSEWYSKNLLNSNKSYERDYPIPPEVSELYQKLKKRSAQNAKVRVKKIKKTVKELEGIVRAQLAEKQKLGKYFRTVNQERLEQSKEIYKSHPISMLNFIYYEREDLQKAYPEVKKGDYTNIINWAISVGSSENKQEEKNYQLLKEFVPQYKTFRIFFKMGIKEVTEIPQTNPLAMLLFTYYSRSDLQQAYPEVKNGKYLKLIKWAFDVCEGQITGEEEAEKELSKFQSWYKEYWSHYQQAQEIPNKIEQIKQLEKNIEEKDVLVKEAQIKLDDNLRKIEELEETRDVNSRKISELEEIKESNTRNIAELKKALESNPLSALFSIYLQRPDLQTTYPEVKDGNFLNLAKWAIDVCDGKINGEQETGKVFSKFQSWFKEYWSNYNDSKELPAKIEKIKNLEDDLANKKKVIQESVSKEQNYLKKIKELQKVTEEYSIKIEELKIINLDKSGRIEYLENENEKIQNELSNLRSDYDTITNSIPYKIAINAIATLDKKAPPNTKRGKFLRKLVYNKLRKKYSTQFHVAVPDFSYAYNFDDTIDSESLSSINKSIKLKPKISIIMPVYNPEPKYLKKAIQSVKNQYYTDWQLCVCDDGSTKKDIREILKDESSKDNRIQVVFSDKNEGISSASNKALELAEGEFTILLDNDDELAKNALLEVVKKVNEKQNVDFIYSDEDKIDEKGNHSQPFFKPDWSPDLFFSYNFPIHISAFRTELLKKIGGFRIGFEGAQDYDLILRYLEKTQNIVHIPKVLYSWRKIPGSTALGVFEKDYAYYAGTKALKEALKRRKLDAYCEEGIQLGTYHIRYRIHDKPLVSIIIPTKSLENIKVCVDSILKKSTYKRLQLVVMDSSRDDKIKNFCKNYEEIDWKRVSLSKFNFSKVNNDGIKNCFGEYVIFLNDDTEVITPSWIEELLEHAQRQEIGVVGAKLLYRDGFVQHAGTIVGIQRHAGNYGGMHQSEGGYFSFARIIRNCSAVTAACMMIRKDVFENIGGFDENMAHSWQDVDLCIRVVNSGKLIVFTPYSVLYHFEGKTRGSIDSSEAELEARKLFREKNKKFIKKGDPFYNPNLSLTVPYNIIRNYTKPLKELVDLYERRSDLRQNFPNEQENNFRNLIDWAATHGIVMDGEKEVLQPYAQYYFEKCSDSAKPLAKKIKLFLESETFQKEFPEVNDGQYEQFLNHLQKS